MRSARYVSDLEDQPDNQYFNVVMNGPSYSTGVSYKNATFNTTRTSPIVAKADDYYLSVARMTMPLNGTPLFIFPVIPNQANPNLSPFILSIFYNNVLYEKQIEWFSQLTNFVVPVQNQVKMVIDPYYYCFEWHHLVNVINTAAADLYATFKAAVPAAPQSVANQAPFVSFDSTTNYFSWVFHQSWASDEINKPFSATVAKFGGNNDFFTFFSGFYYIQYAEVNTGGDGFFMWQNLKNNNFTSIANTLYQQQDIITLSLINNIRRIVITTSSIPVNSEFLPSNTPFGIDNSDGSLQILADFVIQNDIQNNSRGISYITPYFYRLVDLQSNAPLLRFDCQVFWEDTQNNLFPLDLSANQQASIKFVFVSKKIFNRNIYS